MRRVILVFSAVLAGVLIQAWSGEAGETDLAVAVPRGVEVSTLLPIPDGALVTLSSGSAFDIDPDGLPVIADGPGLKVMGAAAPLAAFGTAPVEDFAWMRDGALLLLIQHHLAGLGPKGLVLSLEVPAAGMHIRPAGPDTAYIFGGRDEPGNHNVYLFGRDGKIAKLVTVPGPVSAVAGDGALTYVATGQTVLRFAGKEPVRLMLQAPEPIISLEAGPRGLFYSAAARTGYVTADGTAYDFVRGQGGTLRLRGNALYLLVSDGPHLIRFSPVDAFETALGESAPQN